MKKDSRLAKIYPWIVVALLWVVALLNYMDRQMLSTMRESMQIDIKKAVQACLIKTSCINLYGEKPYMSKRKAL